jgi:5-methylcytosine-specific restriction endonuclease McrA
MSISADLRTQVRQRADFACEYCGVEEIDVGGELTIDHFQPRIHQGGDELENLIYCCVRCNQYKLDYWPILVTDPVLWNPRREPRSLH